MRTSLRLLTTLGAALAVAAAPTAVLAQPAQPASEERQSQPRTAQLEPVADFGSNPGALSMYRYAPEGLPAGSPVVVVLHGCAQGAADYFDGAGWQQAADTHGFAVVAPQQQAANNASRCFNWFEPGDTSRDSGETASILRMVDHTLEAYGGDASRVHVTGLSAGGAMTASLLAAHPDRFAGGGIVAGIPYGCATSMPTAFICMNPGATKTPQQWGDLVRAAHPGHDGRYPTVSIWHGSADYTVAAANASESVKQWTNAHATDQEPDATAELPGETVRNDYTDASGATVVRDYRVAGMGHGTPVKPDENCGTAGAYFLDRICSTGQLVSDWGIGS
ncbi:extracellular catalytic domain type 1 short-chain-length polyhydroxyalkanoate depolymerase [Streptomyces tardus]|uniref:extracellular catalytic domain type 1 short-chain-length polyhydroxyalkanoate depolymerase n=1 Tax=Streptomyces tardus TaxID=2780544 RepID=UPI001F3663DF|nr:PHB depolymerase family esterase [Streptomyces tardus]